VQKRLSNTNTTLVLCRKAMPSLQALKESATAQFCCSLNSRHSPHLMDVNTLATSCWWEQQLFLPLWALESTELFAKSLLGSLSQEKHRTCTEGIHLNTDSWHQVGGHLHRIVSKSQVDSKAVPIPALMAHFLPPRDQQHALLCQSHLPASQPVPGDSLETKSIAASDFHHSQHCNSCGQGMGSLPEHSNGHACPAAHRQYTGAEHHSQGRTQKG